jgi:hypothetical protein
MQALSKFLEEFGPAAFDQKRRDLAKLLTNAAHTAVYIHSANLQVVLATGTLVKQLDYYNLFKDRALVKETCHTALNIHGANMDVQPLFRTVLFGMGSCELDQCKIGLVKEELAKALTYMSDPDNVKPTLIMQCLARLESNATFVIMSHSQQCHYKEPVVVFAMWCLARTLVREHDTRLFGDDDISRQALALVHKVACGGMQLDDANLIEDDRLLLVSYNLPQLLFTLQHLHNAQDGAPRDRNIGWFFVRVQITEHYRAFRMPSPSGDEPAAERSHAEGDEPAAKRSHAEGGGARGEGGSARGEGGSARGEGGSA